VTLESESIGHEKFSSPLCYPVQKSNGIPMNKPISCCFRSKE